MALLSEVRLRIKTLTDWRAICIFEKCERFFTLPVFGNFPVSILGANASLFDRSLLRSRGGKFLFSPTAALTLYFHSG